MTSFNILENTSECAGWNTERFIQEYPRQRMKHMKHTPFPPTRINVVKETMVQSKNVSGERGFTFAVITCDLVTVKIAKKVQSKEPKEIKEVFIMFGAFHIDGSIFFAIAKLTEGSGGHCLLTESGVIVPGSTNRFLKAKMYDRGRRIHILLSTTSHGLNYTSQVHTRGYYFY